MRLRLSSKPASPPERRAAQPLEPDPIAGQVVTVKLRPGARGTFEVTGGPHEGRWLWMPNEAWARDALYRAQQGEELAVRVQLRTEMLMRISGLAEPV